MASESLGRLWAGYVSGAISRRRFLQGAAALGVALPAWVGLDGLADPLAAQTTTPAAEPPLDLAEWTNGYIGMETVMLPRGELLTGRNIHVEVFTPRQLRHPYPVILVPGGASQGLDWIVTADGRRGWALQLVEQGYRVYVVDRPGQGRNPYIPDVHGPFGAPSTYENAVRTVSAPQAAGHTQWPGSGTIGDAALDQFMASQGPAPGNAAGAESAWRFSGAQLLDETGPAIFITRGDGATFAWVSADERPALVKAIVALEAPPTAGGGRGRGAGPAGGAAAPPRLATTPVRLEQLKALLVAVVTAEASDAAQRDP